MVEQSAGLLSGTIKENIAYGKVSYQPASPHLSLSYLTLTYLILSYLILSYLALPTLPTSPDLISSQFRRPHIQPHTPFQSLLTINAIHHITWIIVIQEDSSDADIEDAARAAAAHDFIIAFPEGYNTQVGNLSIATSFDLFIECFWIYSMCEG